MASAADSQTPTIHAPIVVDLGKKRGKQIKQLREGRGKLMDEVSGVLEELKADGSLGPNAQPIIIVVKQKPKRSLAWPLA